MTTPAQALDALRDKLNAISYLSYVKEVLIQKRESITQFPSIQLHAVSLDESDDTDPYVDLSMNVDLYAYIRTQSIEKQIIGDTKTTGILDFENDIKKAIYADPTLGDYCIDSKVTNTVYVEGEHPAKGLIMRVILMFRQNATTRT
jgi:hypothetical protein